MLFFFQISTDSPFKKTHKNKGRKFYKCRNEKCNFFKSADEEKPGMKFNFYGIFSDLKSNFYCVFQAIGVNAGFASKKATSVPVALSKRFWFLQNDCPYHE